MNSLWGEWLRCYNSLVEEIIGTRWARVASWGRKFDSNVRNLCKVASIARSWFVKAKRAGGDVAEFLERWKESRLAFIEAWERCQREWHVECVKRAIDIGDIGVWRLLGDK